MKKERGQINLKSKNLFVAARSEDAGTIRQGIQEASRS